eukprot:CAMPEP_0173113434 /NCGR_PEP_ID=MMETSP1102-20130122/46852_1 /TAXON_ID=49646 /ORGANISM="Geminigera sp., Strain Caron Lab Isolate" /LENGTH=57 /DNA_ID=CAMNT_0014015177 /DNA_START=717 /DNA_END=890 /DNA_ORIENTATION=+
MRASSAVGSTCVAILNPNLLWLAGGGIPHTLQDVAALTGTLAAGFENPDARGATSRR